MLTEVIPSFAKPSPYSPAKHLFFLKKTVKLDVSTNESVVNECVWKCPEWILSAFMQFYEGPDDF